MIRDSLHPMRATGKVGDTHITRHRFEQTSLMKDFAGYLFDIDGVICLGNDPVPGARLVLHALQSRGKKLMFVSNTSSRSIDQVLSIFANMHLSVDREQIFLASEETAKHLARLRPGGLAYLLGSDGLHQALVRHGLRVRAAIDRIPESADFVVVGKDSQLTYAKLTCALRALQQGALLVAVNEDMTVPTSDGLEPGAGAIVASIAAMCGRGPDVSIGKPGPFLLQQALQYANLPPHDCLMVGDTLEADIVAGYRLGMPTALVTTGNFGAMVAESPSPPTYKQPGTHLSKPVHPDWVLASLAELLVDEAPLAAR